MKSTVWSGFRIAGPAAALALAGVLILCAGTVANAHPEQSAASGLQGTWLVTVTQHNCATGAQIGAPFQSLLTFARGGTMTETTSNPMFFPAERGPGHGVWSASRNGTYSAASMAFITLNGVLTMTQKITQQITMGDDRNQFTTSGAQVQFFDPAGNLLRSGCASAVGQRFQ
jgi:hypothetical protein